MSDKTVPSIDLEVVKLERRWQAMFDQSYVGRT